ncbi:MAG: hypothetical protein P8N51_07550 [Pseudomonadales bacterium]|nr:hypothetical protein [Pseudomonadales bacterium]MDG1444683.1 hypothetical protein [Pseudomonadales bacterium]
MGLITVLTRPIVSWLTREANVRPRPLSDFERLQHELKPCDVILVEGRSRISDVIRMTTQSPWTHAALYIGRIHDVEDPDLREIIRHHYKGEPTDRLMIESQLGQGTVVNKIDIYKPEHLRICRPARLGTKDSHQVIRYAVSRLGVDYDVRQIFDLARFMFPWSFLPRRWRSSLFQHNAGRSTRTVCSTMIAEAFAFVQFPILPLVKLPSENGISEKMQLFRRNPKLCTPSDFDYSPYFKIIKYPFIDIHFHDSHHLLPWHGSRILEEDESSHYLTNEGVPKDHEVQQAIEEAVAVTRAAEVGAEDKNDSNADAAAESNDEQVNQ